MTLKAVLANLLILFSFSAIASEQLDETPVDRLSEILNLARGGASGLALRTLDAEQPAANENLEEWLRWERERIAILQSQGSWQLLAAHLEKPPSNLPVSVARWIRTEHATALLESGNNSAALRMLRDLVWSGNGELFDQELAHWRQLIVRVYLADSRLDDALQAILRFQQDYRETSDSWAILRARLYLRSNRASDALALVSSRQEPESKNLELLAALRSKTLAASRVMDMAIKRAVDKNNSDRDRRAAWLIAAEAASDVGNDKARISALERALTDGTATSDRLFTLHADDIWDAYLDYGEKVGNELRLIVGNDAEWFATAAKMGRSDPVQSRALYAIVATRSFNVNARDQAHRLFSMSLEAQKNGGELLTAMYIESARFPDLSIIPPQTRYILVEHVLQKADILAASRLMAGLSEPPPETKPGEWYLRQARVLLLGGQAEHGIEVLQRILANDMEVETSRFLQVVFDLQTIERHEEALQFFMRLLDKELTPQERREILFWAADSCKEMARHLQAARLYLRSAILLEPFAMDPWAQTARYYAAEELAKAGLHADARNIYRGLLNSTKDPGRQAVLRNNIQQLMLETGNKDSRPGIYLQQDGSE